MSEEEEENGEKGFRVTDKRKLKRSKPEGAEEPTAQAGDTTVKDARPLPDNAGVYVGGAPSSNEPPIDFGNFVMSLAHSALVSMGMVEHPDGGESQVDLDTARQTIQILEMLQEKTRNNLVPEEDRLLGSLLYELRMAFVDVSAKKVG